MLAGIGTVYVAIFRNIPLIVQFFIWYLVIPELLPLSIGNWFKQLPPSAQFFSSSIICLGLFTGARVCEQVRSGINALPRGQRAAGSGNGLHAMADVSLRADAGGVPDHRAAAHVRIPELFKNSAVARPSVCSICRRRRANSSTTPRRRMSRSLP